MSIAKAAFEVTGWEEHPGGAQGDGPLIARATVKKTFSGDVVGHGVAELMMTGGEEGRGYMAIERVVGEVHGRSGTFVMEHGGVQGGDFTHSFGYVIPGTGTDELTGLRGEASLTHDERGATFTLDYEIA